MRLKKADTLVCAKFVINLYAANPEMGISEARSLVMAQFKHSMNYGLLKRYKEVVEEQRMKLGLSGSKPASEPAASKGAPVVTVWSPPEEMKESELGSEFFEGLKLIKLAIAKKAMAGSVNIAAAKDGKIEVSCKLSLEKTEDKKYTL